MADSKIDKLVEQKIKRDALEETLAADTVAKLMHNGALTGMMSLCAVLRDIVIAKELTTFDELAGRVVDHMARTPVFAATAAKYGERASEAAWEAGLMAALGRPLAPKDQRNG